MKNLEVGDEVEIREYGTAGDWHRTRVVEVCGGPLAGHIRVAGTRRFPGVPVGASPNDWRLPSEAAK